MRLARRTGLYLCASLVSLLAGCQIVHRSFSGPPQPRPIRPAEPTVEQLDDLQLATEAKESGNYDEALEIFQAILAENPTITTAYLGIGDIYMVKKDYTKAEPAYARAARLEPRNFDAQYGHGLALQMLRRFLDAIRAYHRALTINPEDFRANLNIATTYLQLNDASRAVLFAERAIALDPANGAARANLGAIYEKLGRYEEAVTVYDAALELMGNQPHLMMNQINVLTKQKRYEEAANTARMLVRIEPSPQAWERLGWCAFKLGDYERSMDAYRQAVALDDEYWPALNGIGVNALNAWLLGDKRDPAARLEARNAFRRSLRANSDQPRVVKLMLNYSL